jgi:hypothetical protein
MFGQRHRLRRLAAQLLLAWLFALAAGIVNACVLEPGLREGGAAAGHDRHAAAATPRHDGHAGDHGNRSHDSSKAPCVKFCDEQAAGAQALKQPTDLFTATWLAPGPTNPPSIGTTPRVPGGFAHDHELWRSAIPIPIAFLRLAL